MGRWTARITHTHTHTHTHTASHLHRDVYCGLIFLLWPVSSVLIYVLHKITWRKRTINSVNVRSHQKFKSRKEKMRKEKNIAPEGNYRFQSQSQTKNTTFSFVLKIQAKEHPRTGYEGPREVLC